VSNPSRIGFGKGNALVTNRSQMDHDLKKLFEIRRFVKYELKEKDEKYFENASIEKRH